MLQWGYVVYMGGMKNEHKILVMNLEGTDDIGDWSLR